MNKEKFIDETLNSLRGVRRAQADPFLYEKVLNRMQERSSEKTAAGFAFRWQVAALGLLLLLNAYTAFNGKASTEKTSSASVITNEYFSPVTYNY
jgi:hypothetical protein